MGVGVSGVESNEVVVVRPVDGGAGILTNVDTDDATVFGELTGLNPGNQMLDAQIVKAKAIDQCIVRLKTKEPRLNVPRMCFGRDRSNFD